MAENTPGMATMPLGQQTVSMAAVTRATAQASYADLVALATEGSAKGDDISRKMALLKWLHQARQRLLRLLVVAKWARQQLPLVERCQILSGILSHHDFCFSQAADSLWLLHQELQQARAPIYDVPTAAEVLTTGTYQRLPKCIQELTTPPYLAGEERSSTVEKLNTVLRSRLLDLAMPDQLSSVEVKDGRAIVTVTGEYRAELTLGYGGTLDHWCILKIDLLVGIGGRSTANASRLSRSKGSGESEENVEGRDEKHREALDIGSQRDLRGEGMVEKVKLTEGQQKALAEDLQRRMASKGDPFVSLHEVLHEISMALVTDAALRQARVLRQGRWRDAIKFELLGGSGEGTDQGFGTGTVVPPPGSTLAEADGSGRDSKAGASTGLKISYWLLSHRSDKASAASAVSGQSGFVLAPNSEENLPTLKIELDAERNLKCSHFPVVIDPFTGCEAELALDPGCIDVETLLLRAIRCNIYTRLLDAEVSMKNDRQLSVSDDDIVLARTTAEFVARGTGDNGAQFTALGMTGVKSDVEWMGDGGEPFWEDQATILQMNTRASNYWEQGLNSSIQTLEPFSLENSEEQEAEIWVRAYGGCYMGLTIDLRTGQYKLRAPGGRGLEAAAKELEEALNAGVMAPTEAMVALRCHCLLHLYESLASELGLKAYNGGASILKMPSEGPVPSFGPNTLILSFQSAPPESTYFLSVHLCPEFLPVFTLLQAKAPGKGESRSKALFTPHELERFMVIDVGSNLLEEPDSIRAFLEEGFWPENEGVLETDGGQERMGSWGDAENKIGENYAADTQCQEGSAAKGEDETPGRLDGGEHGAVTQGENVTGGNSGVETSQMGIEASIQSNWQTSVNATLDGSMMDMDIDVGFEPLSGDADQVGHERSLEEGQEKENLAEMGFGRGIGGDSVGAAPLDLDGMDFTELEGTMWGAPTLPAEGFNVQEGHDGGGDINSVNVDGEHVGSTVVPFPQAIADEKLLPRKRVYEGDEPDFVDHVLPSLTSKGATQVRRLHKKRRVGSSLVGLTYGTLIEFANQGQAPLGVYSLVLAKAIEKCALCIKHRRVTEQFAALNIPSVEEIGMASPSFSFKFRLPSIPSPNALRIGMPEEAAAWRRLRLRLEDCWAGTGVVLIPDPHYQRLRHLASVQGSGFGTGEAWNNLPRSQKIRFLPPREEDEHMVCTPAGLELHLNLLEGGAFEQMLEDVRRLWKARMFAVAVQEILGGEGKGAGDGSKKGEARELGEEGRAEQMLGVGDGRSRQERDLWKEGSGTMKKKKTADPGERLRQWEMMRRTVRVEAVGPFCVWLFVTGALQGTSVRVVVEWKRGEEGCRISVAPDPIFPHTKYLEEYVNQGEVEMLLDALRITCGPLFALYSALRPVRYMVGNSVVPFPFTGLPGFVQTGGRPGDASVGPSRAGNAGAPSGSNQDSAVKGMTLPTLLPSDVSVVLRSPYKIRIIFRGQLALDMRCFAGDQVWLQPVTPVRGGERGISNGAGEKGVGVVGSLWCPQFRPFVMDQVANHLAQLEATNRAAIELAAQRRGASVRGGGGGTSSPASDAAAMPLSLTPTLTRVQSNNLSQGSGLVGGFGGSPGEFQGTTVQPRLSSAPSGGSLLPHLNRVSSAALSAVGGGAAGSLELALSQIRALQAVGLDSLRGEVQSAMVGVVDDSVYGGAWVSVMVLKRILRSTLRYLGTVWLFAQFPATLAESFAPGMKAGLISQDMEQPALRFLANDYVYSVNMHRHKRSPGMDQLQLTLQVVSAKRSIQGRQGGPPQDPSEADLTPAEMAELSDFFNRRVTSEPYDASRLASFVTLVTLPVPVLHEFLGLIMWKKETQKEPSVETSSLGALSIIGGSSGADDRNQTLSKPRVELCLESRSGPGGLGLGPWWPAGAAQVNDALPGGPLRRRSNILYDREKGCVKFTVAFLLDGSVVGALNHGAIEGGAAWLPYCVAVRLNYSFEKTLPHRVNLLGVEGSHGGCACWPNVADWEKVKEKLAQTVELVGGGQSAGGQTSGVRLKIVAEALQAAIVGSLRPMARMSSWNSGGATEASLQAPLP